MQILCKEWSLHFSFQWILEVHMIVMLNSDTCTYSSVFQFNSDTYRSAFQFYSDPYRNLFQFKLDTYISEFQFSTAMYFSVHIQFLLYHLRKPSVRFLLTLISPLAEFASTNQIAPYQYVHFKYCWPQWQAFLVACAMVFCLEKKGERFIAQQSVFINYCYKWLHIEHTDR
jgi:hypothetical protein